jgi:acetyl-CoA acetyltransferase
VIRRLAAGIPALTINGLARAEAVMLAAQAIRDGDYEIGIAGGGRT